MQRSSRIQRLALAALLATTGTAAAGEVAVHGTVSQGYLKSSEYNYLTPDTREGTFSFNEAIVNFTARVDDKTRVGAQLLGRDFGPAGNGEVMLDWAFGDYHWKDTLGFRLGKIKTPLGFYNKTRDVDAVRTSILLPQSVYTEGYRTVATAIQGGAVYGALQMGSQGSLEYEVFGGTIEMGSTSFLSEQFTGIVGGAPMLTYRIENRQTLGGQLIWNTPAEGLRVGGTYTTLELDAAGAFALGLPAPWTIDMNLEVNHIYVLSAEYARDALSLAAEYTRWDVDFALENIPYPDGMGGLVPVSATREDHRGGYYLQGAYRTSPVVELGAYYSVFHPDWDNRDGADSTPDFAAWQKDVALTARFDVTDNWTLKAEGHFISGTGDLDGSINPDGITEESWNLFAVKSTFNF